MIVITKSGISSAQTLSESKTVAHVHNECHFIPCLMYITRAKFEEHRSNISKDFLYFIMSSFGTTDDIASFLNKKLNIPWLQRSNISKTKTPFYFCSKRLSK